MFRISQSICMALVSAVLGLALCSASYAVAPGYNPEAQRLKQARQDKGIAPGPKNHWYNTLWGQYPTFYWQGFIKYVENMVEKYGEKKLPIQIPLGPRTLFIITDPEDIHQMLSGPHVKDKLIKGIAMKQLRELLVGDGLAFIETDDKNWRPLHDALYEYFRPGSIKDLYTENLIEHAREFVQRMNSKIDQGTPSFDLEQEMTSYTMRAVAKNMLNTDLSYEDASDATKNFSTVLNFIHSRITNYPFILPLATPLRSHCKYRQAKSEINDLALEFIENDETAESEGKGAASAIRTLRHSSLLSKEALKNQVLALFFGGHDTTKHLLTSSIYRLSQHPEAKAKLLSEIRGKITSTGGLTPQSDLSKSNMPYLDSFVQEVLRLDSPAPGVTREATEDFELRGYHIPKGSVLFVSFHAVHRLKEYWPEPETFNPDRFMPASSSSASPDTPDTCAPGTSTSAAPKRHLRAFSAFGGGERACVGQFFAIQEAKIALIEIVSSGLLIEPTADAVFEPTMVCTTRLAHGLPVTVKRDLMAKDLTESSSSAESVQDGKAERVQ